MTIHFDNTIHITPISDGVSEQEFNQEVGRLDDRIDTIEASSDVTDVVATYSDLENYDTSTLTDNDIIKVLEDSTHDDAISYYRWSTTSETFTYIGSLGPYPTKDYVDNTFSNKSLNNLSSNGNSRLHALKGYKDAGELLTDTEGLADVQSYTHSTFDLSKFTVTGMPTVTDDGIASGFSNSNYVSLNNQQSTTYNKLDIYYQFKTGTIGSIQGVITANSGDISQYIRANGDIRLNVLSQNADGSITLSANTNYWIHLSHNGTTYTLSYSTNGVDYNTIITLNSNTVLDFTTLYFSKIWSVFQGSIDLKQFSITVDGVEVFSGNRTGIDTIKPDDYTVVGTPAITSDGVASGFSSSNYLTKTITSIPLTSTVRIIAGGKYNSDDNNILWHIDALNLRAQVYPNKVLFWGSFTGQTNISITNLSFSTGDDILIDFTLKSGSNIIKIYKNSELIVNNTNTHTFDTTISLSTIILGKYSTQYWFGSIDLNAFKIYVDGNLVYQPCLKIPYTESKTGSKVVDSAYRNRVADMYEQFGIAPYYTLSDNNFTLPQGELYGMMRTFANGQNTTGIRQDELTTPLRYGSKSTLQINTTTDVLRLNPIGFLSGGTQIYASSSYNTLLVPTTQRGNRILDKRNVMFYEGELKGNTILFPNGYTNNNNAGADIIIGKLATDGTFTPYAWTNTNENRLSYVQSFTTANMVLQGVVETAYNVTSNSATYVSTTATSELDYVTISNSGGNALIEWNQRTNAGNDRLLYSYDTNITYDNFDANCVLFCISTANNVYFSQNFSIIDNGTSTNIWYPSAYSPFSYATLPIGTGLTVNTSGNLITTLNPNNVTQLLATTQSDYEARVSGGTVDINALYIIIDTGAIYLGTTLISQKN